MYVIIEHLVYLDIIPLLSSLQCLQVVEGRVVVHQLSSPLCYFLLQIEKDRRSRYIMYVCACVYYVCAFVGFYVFALRPFICLCIHFCLLTYLLPLVLP